VRGAPLIGATAAWGLWLALRADASDAGLAHAHATLLATRPTAVNLRWALDRVRDGVAPLPARARAEAAFALADAICDEDVAINRAIGEHGLGLVRAAAARKGGGRVDILTHCNAGWLATVDWGTATAPIYMAHDAGIDVHVWVDETRPRNQGAALTAWELGQHGVPHTVIADNAGGHLMQAGEVDAVIVGADRIAANGDAANKIGTYLKALAAHDCGVPFWVAAPVSTVDASLANGAAIPIENRHADELHWIAGVDASGQRRRVRVTPEGSAARNPAFDVTPARLISRIVTERGAVPATPAGVAHAILSKASKVASSP
ncbi:MAG: S-methyl-5-thioribose-1-phosphate isomerase, partial [Rhodocyclaceae bacterium]|nr:S-methyl-5-thioribose-1-phosphate isomerase [Rhodocyclaceae bacterium]